MPRPSRQSQAEIARAAMPVFWSRGYEATSMDHLVEATKASRHAIYKDFGGKKALYLSAFDTYQIEVVTPAVAPMESIGADGSTIADYFRIQIDRAEAEGLPGPGCMVANAMTETAPHDADIKAKVDCHNRRLAAGFSNALSAHAPDRGGVEIEKKSRLLVILAQGLWSYSRTVSDVRDLRRSAESITEIVNSWNRT